MFEVGQKVECVDDRLPANPWHRQHPLVKGQIYVVRHASCAYGYSSIDIDGSGREWDVTRFRPLRSTDISIFTDMLNNVPLHEGEKV